MACSLLTCLISTVLISPLCQIVSYLLNLPEKDEEEVERIQINNFDTLWGETGRSARLSIRPINRPWQMIGEARWFVEMAVDNLWVVWWESEPCSADSVPVLVCLQLLLRHVLMAVRWCHQQRARRAGLAPGVGGGMRAIPGNDKFDCPVGCCWEM